MATAKVTKVINKTKQRWEIVVTITYMYSNCLAVTGHRSDSTEIAHCHVTTVIQAKLMTK